jgi:hypothetical protein
MVNNMGPKLTTSLLDEKPCRICGTIKPANPEFFCRDKQGPRGLSGICHPCNKERLRLRDMRFPDQKKARSKAYHLKCRIDVLEHYSKGVPHCECCGENHLEFLSIDHINNDGAEHRRKLANNKTGNFGRIYYWLRNNGYPDGFQVLCHNCNMAKGFYGHCPHQDERRDTNG